MAIDTKKEQERDELHRAIWAIADELRGAVDGWDFKNYVLGKMFYRYISENIANYINRGEHEAGDLAFDYAKMPDDAVQDAKDDLVQEKASLSCRANCFATSKKKLCLIASGRRSTSTKRLKKCSVILKNQQKAARVKLT